MTEPEETIFDFIPSEEDRARWQQPGFGEWCSEHQEEMQDHVCDNWDVDEDS